MLNLSGGNQQKVIIAKWVARRPRILIVDEPSRGIDIGAKSEVHTLLNSLAKQGIASIVVYTHLAQILAVSDRIVVLKQGHITGRIERSEATQDRIIHAATAWAQISRHTS